MVTSSCTSPSTKVALYDEEIWIDLVDFLRSIAKRLVYSANVAFWRGQEKEIIEEIVQETACRFIQRAQQAQSGNLPPIYSLKGFIVIIARHYCIDKQRRDYHLQHTFSGNSLYEASSAENSWVSLCDLATDQLYQEEIFTRLAYQVARFPVKRRRALLIDLANLMYFDEELTPLQRAFLAEGINLQDYQRTLPITPAERTRHVALVSLAYKQIAMCMREISF